MIYLEDIEQQYEDYCNVATSYGFIDSSAKKSGYKCATKKPEFQSGWVGFCAGVAFCRDEINKKREKATEYFTDCEYLKKEISQLKAKLAKYESKGVVVVPKEPTKEMLDAVDWSYYPYEVYKAMIEAGEIK